MRALSISLLTALFVALIAPSPALSQDLDEQLERADELRQAGAFEEGRAFLEDLREEHPENAEVLWRLARIMTDAGGELEEGSDAQRELYLEAVPVAEAAIEADPEHSWAHLSLAIAAGQAGLVSGTRQQIELSRRVKEHADKAIELDEENDLAYHVRGRWHHEVASLGWVSRTIVRAVYGGLPDASFEAAEANLRTALETRERIVHRLELGRTLTELGKEEEAREQLQAAIQMPEEDPNDLNYKREAHQLLMRL
ncbi:MAG: hypothetical protein GVY12_00415 [Bacteroidetes bacterium]|jgi:tetratricopeptide (TPR) repeat protein|nr:hypothetical protein [Bacteroidota bacterium]